MTAVAQILQVPIAPSTPILSSTLLRQRQCVVTVGTTKVQNLGDGLGLRVSFTIKNTLKPNEPNTCDLKIWNLADATRKQIAAQTTVPVQIDAGYAGTRATIYRGELRFGQSVKDGPDVVLELSTGDGDQAIAIARANASLPRGSNATSAIQTMLDAMGIGYGNLQSGPIQAAFKGSTVYSKGAVIKGNAAELVIDLCASLGLEFSVQRGQAQFLPLGRPLTGQAYLLSAAADTNGDPTGLIGSPTVDSKGILSCTALMMPGLQCGGPIQLDSEFVKGLFRIHAITYDGDTAGQSWYAQIEAARYGVAV